MSEIYNCWQCKHYSVTNKMCKSVNITVLPNEPICQRFMFSDAYKADTKLVKKKESASDRIALIAKEIEWLRLDPGCCDQMVYDSLSTIETMLKHLSTSIKGTERDFMMEVAASE